MRATGGERKKYGPHVRRIIILKCNLVLEYQSVNAFHQVIKSKDITEVRKWFSIQPDEVWGKREHEYVALFVGVQKAETFRQSRHFPHTWLSLHERSAFPLTSLGNTLGNECGLQGTVRYLGKGNCF